MKAVILAGGLGSRLKPFTDILPKPLLPLGDKSLMEIQIEHLKLSGFSDIFVAINYKSNMVRSFLGTGEKYGVNLYFSEEKMRLGTCGPVKLLESELTEPFLLVNGDILTKFDFSNILDFSLKHKDSPLTIGTKIVTTPFRFGTIESNGDYLVKVEEKPDLNFEILAGIYILKPSVFDYIPKDEYFGIDKLIQKLLLDDVPVTKYLIKDYWLDIGVVEDYEKAKDYYTSNYSKT